MPETKKKFTFKIGADPEFNILIQDRHFKAETLFKSLFNNKLEEKTQGFMIEGAGEIGWDGNPDTAEIRPNPAHTPEEVVANIEKLIGYIVANGPMLELSTLCDMGIVGGHIHFELPSGMENKATILANLNKKLSSFYIPLIQGEDILNMKTRTRVNYGRLIDYRVGSHNNKYTFEFRTPSAEWMTTKKIALSMLAYFATIYNEILHHPKNFIKCNEFIFKNQKQSEALQDLAMSNYIIIMENIKNKIKKNIKTFESYERYKEEIDFILSTDKVQKEKKKVNYNIATGWNMVSYKQPNKRTLFAKTITTAKNRAINLETMIKLLPLNYNPDINVGELVNALKQKIIRLNWKLKHVYYFFGLKEGIKDFIIMNKNFDFLAGQSLIKTRRDYDKIIETFQRINGRFEYLKTRRNPDANKNNENYILIGIPYDVRLEIKNKSLLERIYEIEKNKLKAFKVDSINLPVMDNTKDEGEIYKIYSKTVNLDETLSNEGRIIDNLRNRDMAQQELSREERESNN